MSYRETDAVQPHAEERCVDPQECPRCWVRYVIHDLKEARVSRYRLDLGAP